MSHLIPFHLEDLHKTSKEEANKLKPPVTAVMAWAPKVEDALKKYPIAKTASEEPIIPDPSLFKGLIKQPGADTGTPKPAATLPTAAECAVHLELLEAFYHLRSSIIKSDELDTTFGVVIENKTVYKKEYDYKQRKYVKKPKKLKDPTWQKRRREKWQFFLTLAVGRFRSWSYRTDLALQLAHVAKEDAKEGSTSNGKQPDVSADEFPLPPLDVLMVWHAFLLNPTDFMRFHIKADLNIIPATPFPWAKVYDAINRKDWTYNLKEADKQWARTVAQMEPDLLDYLVEAGKNQNGVSEALKTFGSPGTTTPGIDDVLNTAGAAATLTLLETKFLDTMRKSVRARDTTDKKLADNVQRQAGFVDKMHAHLWIRSPAVEGTLRRACARYEKFLRLFALYPGKTLVPTLDVDVVWHTHQLSAAAYKADMVALTGRLINHDDKIVKKKLDDGMGETANLFFMRFGQEYSYCLCWDCEATASAVEEPGDGEAELEDEFVEVDEETQGREAAELAEQVHKEVEYYRCVELARRHGKTLLPTRLKPMV